MISKVYFYSAVSTRLNYHQKNVFGKTVLDEFTQCKITMALHFLECLPTDKAKLRQKVNLQQNTVCLEK